MTERHIILDPELGRCGLVHLVVVLVVVVAVSAFLGEPDQAVQQRLKISGHVNWSLSIVMY